MANRKKDITKNVEAILGRELGVGELERITFVQAVATYDRLPGITVLQNQLILQPNQCHEAPLLDVTGIGLTDNDGRRTFRLRSFLCSVTEKFTFPMNCVATPLSLTPCFVTLNHTLINNGEDVEIQIFTWDAAGAPAPRVSFDWRCRVELQQIIT